MVGDGESIFISVIAIDEDKHLCMKHVHCVPHCVSAGSSIHFADARRWNMKIGQSSPALFVRADRIEWSQLVRLNKFINESSLSLHSISFTLLLLTLNCGNQLSC